MALEERAKKLIEYFEDLSTARQHFERTWQEVSDNSLARRDFIVEREPGIQRTIRIYDSTSSDAHELLVAALHALLTNPATRWFDLRFQDDALNDIEEAKLWLDDIKPLLHAAFSRPESGFTTQIAEVYSDWCGFGTGAMFVKEDVAFGPRFMSRPLSEIFIDDTHEGIVNTVFRRFELKAWQAILQFGEAQVPKAAALSKKNPNTKMRFLHHVRARENPLPGNIDASGMPWESIYISLDEKKIVQEGGFHEMPYMVPRWRVDSRELYGRGPAVRSLPEQKMLNAIWRTFIRNIEKAADPPVLVDDDGVMPGSQLRVTPHAQIVVRNDGGSREPVRYLESRAQLQWSADLIETRSKKIEKAFHAEIIQAFQDPRMTATQVLELARLSQRILSPVLGRGQIDLLDPMLNRAFGIISRRTDFPEAPFFLRGQELRLEYVSPVARAQKQSEAQAILDTFAAAAAIAEKEPNVMDNFDLDTAVRLIASGQGVPVAVLRPKADVIQIRRTQARIEEQDRQAQQLMEGGDTVAKLLPGIAALQEVAPAA